MQHNPTMFVFHATIEAPTTAEVLVASEAGISAGHFQRPVDLYLATMRFVCLHSPNQAAQQNWLGIEYGHICHHSRTKKVNI